MAKSVSVDRVWLERIAQTLSGLEYGSVQIIVHDGAIVQVEKTERRRYESSAKPLHKGGEAGKRPH